MYRSHLPNHLRGVSIAIYFHPGKCCNYIYVYLCTRLVFLSEELFSQLSQGERAAMLSKLAEKWVSGNGAFCSCASFWSNSFCLWRPGPIDWNILISPLFGLTAECCKLHQILPAAEALWFYARFLYRLISLQTLQRQKVFLLSATSAELLCLTAPATGSLRAD